MSSTIEAAGNEARSKKAREMLFRRPACKAMRWDFIRDDLIEMQEVSEEHRYMDSETWDKISKATEWDDELIQEFQIGFSDLSAQCDQMYRDMCELRERDREVFYGVEDDEYDDPPALFDLFFPAINTPGEVWGYDITEHDYYGFDSSWDEDAARKRARKRLMRLTKEQLISLAGLCMEIARQYMSIRSRFDALTGALGIVTGEAEARRKVAERIEALYEAANYETEGFKYLFIGEKSLRALDAALTELPDRVWVE